MTLSLLMQAVVKIGTTVLEQRLGKRAGDATPAELLRVLREMEIKSFEELEAAAWGIDKPE